MESQLGGFALGLIDALDEPVMGFDVCGRLMLANPAARRLWTLPDASSVGFTCRAAFRFEAQDRGEITPEVDPLGRALAGHGVVRERLRVVPQCGKRSLMDVTASTLRDGNGEVVGAALTFREPQPDSAAEEELQAYASDLMMLTEISRALAELQDPDEAASVICTIATGATGAIAVLLWQVIEDELFIFRSEGALMDDALADLVDNARPGAMHAGSEASAVVERAGGELDEDASTATVVCDGVTVPLGTAWHVPLATAGRVAGVLSIVWPGFLTDLDRPGRLIDPLAHHAATALERASLLRRLNDLARTDTLTELANRRVWLETLEHELLRARRDSLPISLVLIDIDHFKAYNDRNGHPEGDRLLRDAAKEWCQRVRATDLLARIGGEEFGAILPACPIEEAQTVAERLRTGMPARQTCSLGIAQWDATATASELYAAADAALYRAKTNGRNRIELGSLPEPTGSHATRQ